jgi:hypothetical protein
MLKRRLSDTDELTAESTLLAEPRRVAGLREGSEDLGNGVKPEMDEFNFDMRLGGWSDGSESDCAAMESRIADFLSETNVSIRSPLMNSALNGLAPSLFFFLSKCTFLPILMLLSNFSCASLSLTASSFFLSRLSCISIVDDPRNNDKPRNDGVDNVDFDGLLDLDSLTFVAVVVVAVAVVDNVVNDGVNVRLSFDTPSSVAVAGITEFNFAVTGAIIFADVSSSNPGSIVFFGKQGW